MKSITLTEPPLLNSKGCEESLMRAQKELIDKLKTSFETKDTTLVMRVIFEFFVGQDIQNNIPPEALEALKSNLAEMEALANADQPFPDLNTVFEIPTLIISSENVMPVLKCANEALISNTPKAKHLKIQGASHDMWMTHPEVMANHIRAFVKNN